MALSGACARCEWAVVNWTTIRPTRVLVIPCSGLPIGATPRTSSGIYQDFLSQVSARPALSRLTELSELCRFASLSSSSFI
eukprot:1972715-Pleurochrysis_carterae.AAC.1